MATQYNSGKMRTLKEWFDEQGIDLEMLTAPQAWEITESSVSSLDPLTTELKLKCLQFGDKPGQITK